jgi:hypothetical protein
MVYMCEKISHWRYGYGLGDQLWLLLSWSVGLSGPSITLSASLMIFSHIGYAH